MNIATSEPSMDTRPFPFVELSDFLSQKRADYALNWLETEVPWQLRVESFYEQYEFSLLSCTPPARLVSFLVQRSFIDTMKEMIRQAFVVTTPVSLVGISAHKLIAGQTIRLHNDYIGPAESHRVLVHLNRGWSMSDGGLLMLFGSNRAEDVRALIPPRHGSAFAFEISHHSYHAVSTVRGGPRYTLVYTFRVDR